MSKEIINLTGLIVQEETARILESYLDTHPERAPRSSSSLRQELMAFVLKQIPKQYAVVECSETEDSCHFQEGFTEQRSQIRSLIQQGIERICQPKMQAEFRSAQESEAGVSEPSHWFG